MPDGALTEYQSQMLALGQTAVAALVFGLCIVVLLLAALAVRHL